MRVVVAADAIAGLTPQEASATIAELFADRGAEVAVVSLAVTGPGLAHAVSTSDPSAGFQRTPTALEVGEALARGDDRLVLDLTDAWIADFGREALTRFGSNPTTALEDLARAWQGRDLIALVPEEQAERQLTGLTGLASTQGRADGLDLSGVLAADAAAERWAGELGVEPGPGSGAAGGLGLILAAVGARIADPLTYLTQSFALDRTMGHADLVVTGAELLDFHAVGGPVVRRVVGLSGQSLRPVVAIVGRNFVSSRELRLAGLESAYPILAGPGETLPSVDQLRQVASKVASSWTW